MKLSTFTEAVENFNVSEEDMERVFQVVSKRELDQRDIGGLAQELVDDGGFTRSPGSAQFVINRMHILVHGMAPHGYSERSAEKMFGAAKPLLAFMQAKGYDVEDNIRRARIDLQSRTEKINQTQATQMMADFFKQNKELINARTRSALHANRNKIIADIMTGVTPAEAFQNSGWTKNKGGGQATPQGMKMESNNSLLSDLLKSGKEFDVEELTDELTEYVSVVETFMDSDSLMEGEHDASLDALIKQMEAAKRGLSIVSKLKAGAERGKHASRVMTNMNKIRGRIKTLQKAIAANKAEEEA